MIPSRIDTTITVTITTNVMVRSSPQLGQMTLRSSPTMSSKFRTMPRRGEGVVRCTLFDLDSVGTALAMVVIPESGRGGATRTPDPRFWRPLLYQLSYTPVPVGANSIRRLRPRYLVSRWAVCFRHRGQNFLTSSRSGSFFLFLTVV